MPVDIISLLVCYFLLHAAAASAADDYKKAADN